MRPYRGLTKEGKWVYGSHAEVDGKHYIIPKGAKTGLLEGMTFNDLGIYPFTEVIPETVGQSTGSISHNKKEIWEYSLVKCIKARYVIGDESIGKVYYNEYHSAYWVFAIDKSFNVLLGLGNWWEVVDDINSNPELLEQDNE